MNKINNYITFEDFLEQAGYRTHHPAVGSVGQALIKASKNQGRSSFINKCLDSYFRKLRQQRKKNKENGNKEQNSRHNLQSDASNNSKKCG